jgi:hypothetical protein
MGTKICGNCRGSGTVTCPSCGVAKLVACPDMDSHEHKDGCGIDCDLCGGDGVVLLLRAGKCEQGCGPNGIPCGVCGGRGVDDQLDLPLPQ